MKYIKVELEIVSWLKQYPGFVVGISGGVDSALVSTLCAKTARPTILVSIPIHQPASHLQRAHDHMEWLKKNYANVQTFEVDLTETYEVFKKTMPTEAATDLALVNARSRLRMTTLYNFANSNGCVVAGTGNKVEDFGVGFFTKYGDGGVDISPIGELLKTEVWEMAKLLGVSVAITSAKPTDGLWEDDRSDEDQIGATYPELEFAMEFVERNEKIPFSEFRTMLSNLNQRQQKVLDIYIQRHYATKHKMSMPPVCPITRS